MHVQLLEAGNSVVATCRSPQKAEALQSLASSHQGRLVILSLDVNVEVSVQVMHSPERAHHEGSVLVHTIFRCILASLASPQCGMSSCSMQAAANEVEKHFPNGIDHLINNAGILSDHVTHLQMCASHTSVACRRRHHEKLKIADT